MRKFKIALLLIVSLSALLILPVFLKMAAQRQVMGARGPLSVEDLDQLAAQWSSLTRKTTGKPSTSNESLSSPSQGLSNPSQAAESHPENPSEGSATTNSQIRPVNSAVADASAGAESAVTGGPSLMRALTRAEKEKMAEDRRRNAKARFGGVAALASEFTATTLRAIGWDDGVGFYYYDAGNVAYDSGDLETASRLFREALGHSLSIRQWQQCCVRLAWMEEDAKVANRLLELACPADDSRGYCLYDAVTLCYFTVSYELFEYYAARSEKAYPSLAEELRQLRTQLAHRQSQKESVGGIRDANKERPAEKNV